LWVMVGRDVVGSVEKYGVKKRKVSGGGRGPWQCRTSVAPLRGEGHSPKGAGGNVQGKLGDTGSGEGKTYGEFRRPRGAAEREKCQQATSLTSKRGQLENPEVAAWGGAELGPGDPRNRRERTNARGFEHLVTGKKQSIRPFTRFTRS